MGALSIARSPLELCQRINHHVAQHIQFSDTDPYRGWNANVSNVTALQERWRIVQGLIRSIRGQFVDEEISLTQQSPFIQRRPCLDNQKLVALSKKESVGNCGEMARLGVLFGNSLRTKWSIERFYINGGDHGFIVINRPRNAGISNYTEWSNDTVVADPWTKQCYYAKEIAEKLYDYLEVDLTTMRPTLEKFVNKAHKFLALDNQVDCKCEELFTVCKRSLEKWQERVDFWSKMASAYFWRYGI